MNANDRLHREKVVLFSLFTLLWPLSSALADDVDATKLINERLAQLKDYNLADKCEKVRVPPVVPADGGVSGHYAGHHGLAGIGAAIAAHLNSNESCTPQIGHLSVVSLKTVSINFTSEDMVQNALPEHVTGESFVSINCSTLIDNASFDYKLTVRNATTTVTTHGITNTIEGATKVTFNYAKAVGGEFGVKDTYQVSNSTSNQVVVESTSQEEKHMSLPIDAMTNFISRGYISASTDRLLWRADVILDGVVAANKDKIVNVSDVLPLTLRTVEMDGYIENVHSTDVKTETFVEKLTTSECDTIKAKHVPMQYLVNYLISPNTLTEQH